MNWAAPLGEETGKEVWRDVRVANMQSYRTPGTPGQHIAKLKEEHMDKAINSEQQALYCSGVGMLLYLLKHSRPCLANPVRELAKALDGANFDCLQRVDESD